jgi:hypothetical protein
MTYLEKAEAFVRNHPANKELMELGFGRLHDRIMLWQLQKRLNLAMAVLRLLRKSNGTRSPVEQLRDKCLSSAIVEQEYTYYSETLRQVIQNRVDVLVERRFQVLIGYTAKLVKPKCTEFGKTFTLGRTTQTAPTINIMEDEESKSVNDGKIIVNSRAIWVMRSMSTTPSTVKIPLSSA